MSIFSLYFRALFGTVVRKVFLQEDCNGKKDPCAVFEYNNDRLFPEKYTMKDHISNTKLEKGDNYYIQTRTRIFFPLQSYSRKTLRKNVPKSARKYKRNVLMPPGYPIILLKSN